MGRRAWLSITAVVAAGCCGYAADSAPSNSFRFSIVGDRTGGAAPGVYERVLREVEALHPAFVINTGDTIEGGDDSRAEREWVALRPLWIHLALYFTPGNHDVFSEASRRIYEEQTKRPTSYSFDHEQSHFTVLDNSGSNELSESQMEFLRNDLEKNKGKSPKFIFFHRPFWIPYVMFKSGDFPLHQLARKYGVTGIINGHMHQFMYMKQDGITYMVVGSSGGSIARGQKVGQGFREGWFFQHVAAQVSGGTVKFTVKEIDSPAGPGHSFNAEDWDRVKRD